MGRIKFTLAICVMSIILCTTMLFASTYAWMTDSVSNTGNKIQSGNISVDLVKAKAGTNDNEYESVVGKTLLFKKEADNWTPGDVYMLEPVYVQNNSDLSVKYQYEINGIDGDLKDNFEWKYLITDKEHIPTTEDLKTNFNNETSYHALSSETINVDGNLDAGNISDALVIIVKMKENASLQIQGEKFSGISLTLIVSQTDQNAEMLPKVTDQPSFDKALKEAQNGGTILLSSNNGDAPTIFTMPETVDQKQLSFVGQGDNTVIDLNRVTALNDVALTFYNVKIINAGNIPAAKLLKFVKCRIDGTIKIPSNAELMFCQFESPGSDVAVWIKGTQDVPITVTMTDCRFTKAEDHPDQQMLYIDNPNTADENGAKYTVNLKNCKVSDQPISENDIRNSDVEGKTINTICY